MTSSIEQPACLSFKQLDQYASSPENKAYCNVKLAVSSLVVTVTNKHCQYSFCLSMEKWPSRVGVSCLVEYENAHSSSSSSRLTEDGTYHPFQY